MSKSTMSKADFVLYHSDCNWAINPNVGISELSMLSTAAALQLIMQFKLN